MRVYLDACCLSRLTDDQSQLRIHEEAEAVERFFRRMRTGSLEWISSEALVEEINGNPTTERRLENLALLSQATETIEVNDHIINRAKQLQAAGYGSFDALHLACAEGGRADVLLTTDERFLRKALRGDGSPLIPVRNPLSWI